MADTVQEVVSGEGFSVGHLDAMGEGPGFRKVRRELGVEEMGVNAIVLPAGVDTGFHFHDDQEELYFVHKGTLELEFGDGSKHELTPGGACPRGGGYPPQGQERGRGRSGVRGRGSEGRLRGSRRPGARGRGTPARTPLSCRSGPASARSRSWRPGRGSTSG